MLIEAIASTVSEALELERLGVDRIELVTAVTEGGLTPSLGLIEAVTSKCTIPVNVMLKTRKDYQMDDKDLQVILRDLELIKKTKAHGIVFGALCGKHLNHEMIDAVIASKGHLSFTLNRSFDQCDNMEQELQYISTLPIDRMLTSGHEKSVIDGAKNLAHIQEVCSNVIVMAGAGITVENAKDFVEMYRPCEIHVGSTTHENGSWASAISEERVRALVALKSL